MCSSGAHYWQVALWTLHCSKSTLLEVYPEGELPVGEHTGIADEQKLRAGESLAGGYTGAADTTEI